MPELLLEAVDLARHYTVSRGLFRPKATVKALNGVSFTLAPKKTLAVVGESGCGKSTLARQLTLIEPPTRGSLKIRGTDAATADTATLQRLRREVQMVFQNPFASLNPRKTIETTLAEPLLINTPMTALERRERVAALATKVGLRPEHLRRYPHMFSGGQRQRIAIARAMILNPGIVVADEPVSALDVSIQAQVVNLLEELQEQFNLTYLFIAHDLSMVRHISKRVAVMYLGVIVELTDRDELYSSPLHPYTQALLSAVPIPDPLLDAQRKRTILEGDVPSPANPPSGCRFRTRCPIAQSLCAESRPEFREVKPGHFVACHLVK